MRNLWSAAVGTLLVWSLALCFLAPGIAGTSAQSQDDQDSDSQAVYLVARSPIADPYFHESVVLMLPHREDNPLVVGLIINKPARVPLSEIFPGEAALKDRTETAYFGGPVEPRSPGVIFRSTKAAKQAIRLFGDVYVSFDRDFVKGLLEKPEPGQDLRLFLGRAQWAPGKLQGEMVGGAWSNLRAEGSLIFNADQTFLWRTLSERAQPIPQAKLAERPFLQSRFLQAN